ncbi:hypothetical protein [Flagellimonas onchidii]|uniref:hypothetical protein n=1 Tax=Flagellimonas onchidii TaxID=2562684 RepID=UPI0010A5B9D3|nr:hypothetical protein [Allomuricauda onchidii]
MNYFPFINTNGGYAAKQYYETLLQIKVGLNDSPLLLTKESSDILTFTTDYFEESKKELTTRGANLIEEDIYTMKFKDPFGLEFLVERRLTR